MTVKVEVTLIADGEPTNYEPLVFKTIWHARWWQFKLFRRVFGNKFWTWPRRIA
jgi:hypothetical protein